VATTRDIANRWPITVALMLATLMNTLDSTIANVALPHIQGSVSASQDQITWVLTSYIIAAAIMTPLSGWLALRIGRKLMFQISIVAFTIASMLCGIATSLPEMVLFRLLQGIAGASMMPLSQNVMLDLFPPEMLPRVISLWSAAIIMGPILGPALGGWLTENLSWRWVFFINVPIGILAYITLQLYLDRDRGGLQRPFDFLGFGALVLFIGGLQFMLDRGPSQDWFTSPEIWTEAVFAAIGLWVFLVQTVSAPHPFFHRDLARDRNFVTTTTIGFFTGVLMFGTTALLPTMMQNLLGYSALQSGWASMPRGLGSMLAFLAVPAALPILGPRLVLIIGLGLSLAATIAMTHFDLMMTASSIGNAGFIQGLGTGLLFAPLGALAYVTLSPVHRTEGTIVSTLARSLGSSVGISLLQAYLIQQSATAHAALNEHIRPSDPVFHAVIPSIMNPESPIGAQLLNGEITRQAGMIAYDNAFSVVVVTILAMMPLILLVRTPGKGPAIVEMRGE